MKKTLAALSFLLLPALAGAQTKLAFVALDQPCRMVDTRATGTPLVAGQVFAVTAVGVCEIPFEAKAIEANLTVTNTQGPGYLAVLRPSGRIPASPVVKTSVLNFAPGQDVANAALVPLGAPSPSSWDGSFWLCAGVSGTDVIVDVVGYYIAA